MVNIRTTYRGVFWAPPPESTKVALEMLAEAINKRPLVPNVLVPPTYDTLLEKEFGTGFRSYVNDTNYDSHEYLLCAVILPIIRRDHWKGNWFIGVNIIALYCKEPL